MNNENKNKEGKRMRYFLKKTKIEVIVMSNYEINMPYNHGMIPVRKATGNYIFCVNANDIVKIKEGEK